mmetsp:Transcript_24590/g.59307  ORF Transcript_24590/g.59307 Transcript_24590/m.59307 type:complete len:365 (+) Transcript_24590:393-1487(+)
MNKSHGDEWDSLRSALSSLGRMEGLQELVLLFLRQPRGAAFTSPNHKSSDLRPYHLKTDGEIEDAVHGHTRDGAVGEVLDELYDEEHGNANDEHREEGGERRHDDAGAESAEDLELRGEVQHRQHGERQLDRLQHVEVLIDLVEEVLVRCGRGGDGKGRPEREHASDRHAHPRLQLDLQRAPHNDLPGVRTDHGGGLAGGEKAKCPQVERVVAQALLQRVPFALQPEVAAHVRRGCVVVARDRLTHVLLAPDVRLQAHAALRPVGKLRALHVVELLGVHRDDRQVDEEGGEQRARRLQARVPDGVIDALVLVARDLPREDEARVKVQIVRHDHRADGRHRLRHRPRLHRRHAPPPRQLHDIGAS